MLQLFGFCIVIIQILCFVNADIRLVDGHLTDVRDNCTIGDLNSCGPGKCCVKDALAYIPEYTGVRASYVIECRPLQKEGHLCYTKDNSPFCPCESNLVCDTTKGLGAPFGHCSSPNED